MSGIYRRKRRRKEGLEERLGGYSKAASATLSLSEKKTGAARALTYTAAGAAGLAGLAMASTSVEADTVSSNIFATPVVLSGAYSPYYINIDGVGHTEVRLWFWSSASSRSAGVKPNPLFRASNYIAFGTIISSYSFAKRFFSSSSIGSGASWTNTWFLKLNSGLNPTSTNGSWALGDRGYIGVYFKSEVDGQWHYAWLDVEVNHPSMTLYGWAWETTPNTAIHAPSIAAPTPEPGTLALLAMGAGGLAAWRRRRKKAVVADGDGAQNGLRL